MMRQTNLSCFTILLCVTILGSVAPSLAAAEQKVMFAGSAGASIHGTVLLPDGPPDTKYPAVLLVAGSGPTDRDGNQPPALISDLLKQVADALARQGIASLRCDKRGMHANSADMPKTEKAAGDFFRWENFVSDAVLEMEFLRTYPGIDGSRVGIVGHSEGGIIALATAKLLAEKNATPVALMLLGTPGRSMGDLLEEQVRGMLVKQKANEVQIGYFMAEYRKITVVIKETSKVPENVTPGLAVFFPKYLGQFLRGSFNTDPIQLAKAYSGPVLVMNGGADVQVSPERDAKVLDAALKERSPDDHALFIITNASHNLKPLKSAEDTGYTGDVDATALRELTHWAAAKLGAKPVAK